jgi:hypothetical protein
MVATFIDLPDSPYERARMLENILVAACEAIVARAMSMKSFALLSKRT